MKRKIYVVGGSNEYANWMQGEIVHNMEDADLVLFTGGEDVTPLLYGDPKHPFTGNNYDRDLRETEKFKKAQELGKHVIGICRGSQFTCAMSGGRLVQHQENPHLYHQIRTSDGKQITISSTHHQAMFPYDMNKEDYKILAWTKDMLRYHQDGNGQEMINNRDLGEVEICYFPKTKVLGIQGHPEFMDKKRYPDTFDYLTNLLDNHMEDKL